MSFRTFVISVVMCGAAASAAIADPGQQFEFVALGDMPYNIPGDYEKFDRLIDRVNAIKPAVTLHVGDIISGLTTCSDAHLLKVRAQFDRFEGALVYTPGDNEWTDCHRFFAGRYDPLERLSFLRRHFYSDPGRSLGRSPIIVEPQSRAMAQAHGAYVENVRFVKNDIVFASVHVVGSWNNYNVRKPEAVREYEARNAANVAWIDAAFETAQRSAAKGLVLFWQANVHATPRRNPDAEFPPPYRATIDAVERGAKAFARPVLVIYGDFHFYDVRPFLNWNRKPVQNVTRLQVFGDSQVHAVRVKVDPASEKVFSFQPLIVRENGKP